MTKPDLTKIIKAVSKGTKGRKSKGVRLSSLAALAVVFVIITVLALGYAGVIDLPFFEDEPSYSLGSFSYENIPEYDGEPFVILNGGVPYFTPEEFDVSKGLEFYGELDTLGRCSYAIAIVSRDTMPSELREGIGNVEPSGWQSVKYDCVSGGWLYNRCHLIGYQLTGENDNDKNLITGTRYLNMQGMVKFENKVADYVEETGNHVIYRVTPIFVGDELVARGVVIEAWSVEDGGEEISFNVFCYNVQPGIVIDYSDGDSYEE